jgi:lysophospholipase L1-like esterase
MTGYRNESCLKTRFHFNSEGMRDVEHIYDKPPGVYRIAVIGDSFVNAQEVELEDTFFRRLQHNLGGQGYNVEVLGFGVRGFGTDQEYRLLENFALKYLPDLVVLAFVSNDVRNNSLALEKNPAKPYF